MQLWNGLNITFYHVYAIDVLMIQYILCSQTGDNLDRWCSLIRENNVEILVN